MNNPALIVRDLSVTLPTENGSAAVVDRVSLELGPGEFVGLAGESGCGKTMLAMALMGILPSRSARIEVVDMAVCGRSTGRSAQGLARERGRRLAMIFQEPGNALDPVFSIGWQIRAVLRQRFGLSRRAARRKTVEALANAGFADPSAIYRAYPHQLSGGMQQMAMIAMACAVEPKVLIADEPTTALDVTTQRLAMQQLQKLRDESGTSILLISHDIGLIANYCRRILVMYCGRIVENCNYPDFYQQPRHPYSAGLIGAMPRLNSDTPVSAMKGNVADPAEWPPGCRFAPRCDHASAICSEQAPMLKQEQGRHYACHHPL